MSLILFTLTQNSILFVLSFLISIKDSSKFQDSHFNRFLFINSVCKSMMSFARKIMFENIANNELLSNIAHLIMTRKYKINRREEK